MSSPGVHVVDHSWPQQSELLNGLVVLHAACILNDCTMATFLPPLSYARMHDRWAMHYHEARADKRVIIVDIRAVANRRRSFSQPHALRVPLNAADWPTLPNTTTTTTTTTTNSATHEIAGVITLSLPASETGPFRALVQNLFVHPLHRRTGVASGLLRELERQAAVRGRWSLMLDTTVGTPAVGMYEGLGWHRLGVVKDYGLKPTGNGDECVLADEVWFWKDLRGEGRIGLDMNSYT